MKVTVNGRPRELAPGTPLADLVAEHTRAERGVAVAVDGEVVPRAQWTSRALRDGDAVELLTAVQGG